MIGLWLGLGAVLGAVLAGPVGYLLGVYLGAKSIAVHVVNASIADVKKAEETAAAEKKKVDAAADAEIVSIPGKTPEQVLADLAKLE